MNGVRTARRGREGEEVEGEEDGEEDGDTLGAVGRGVGVGVDVMSILDMGWLFLSWMQNLVGSLETRNFDEPRII